MVNYLYDCYSILNKVYSDKTFIKQAISSTVIEEKNRSLTIKTCYGVLDKDIELSYYLSALTEKSPKLAIRTILKISMYCIKYLEKHEYAITKNAVELTKKLGKKGASGFVNAFLRRFVKEKISLPTDKAEYLSVKYSYPNFLVKELIKDYGIDRAERIMSSENKKTCLSFYSVDGEKYLTELGKTYQKTPFNNVFLVDNFVRNSDYDKGIYTYQALGSVAICDVVEPCDNLLDCCSAPGGKSIRLSYKCNKVTSWDIHPHRVDLINDYKLRMKRENVYPEKKNSKDFEDKYLGYFNAVLCDAPCSGTGVFNDNPDMKLNRSEESLFELVKEQSAILDNVSKYVKLNGYLYYSTCSILKRENLSVIEKFVREHDEYILCDVESPLKCEKQGKTIQFLPDISDGLGFFVAKLKRIR